MSSIIKVDTIQNQSGANIISESANTITVGASGDTVTIPSGGTLGGAGTFDLSSGSVTLNAGMKNTPFFEATRSGAHSFSAGTATKVPFNVASIDTDSAFDTSNNRFTVPSGKDGKYFFYASVYQEVPTNDDRVFCYFYKNGSNVYNTGLWGKTSKCTALASVYLDLSASDYIEVFTNTEGAGTVSIDPSNVYTRFFGMRVIGA